MTPKSHDADIALLKFLVRAGVVTNQIAQEAEKSLLAQKNGMSAFDWLTRSAGLQEEQLARTIAAHAISA